MFTRRSTSRHAVEVLRRIALSILTAMQRALRKTEGDKKRNRSPSQSRKLGGCRVGELLATLGMRAENLERVLRAYLVIAGGLVLLRIIVVAVAENPAIAVGELCRQFRTSREHFSVANPSAMSCRQADGLTVRSRMGAALSGAVTSDPRHCHAGLAESDAVSDRNGTGWVSGRANRSGAFRLGRAPGVF